MCVLKGEDTRRESRGSNLTWSFKGKPEFPKPRARVVWGTGKDGSRMGKSMWESPKGNKAQHLQDKCVKSIGYEHEVWSQTVQVQVPAT